MTLASSVFKAMLNGHFMEGRLLAEMGMVEVPLPDDDPTAFTILLDIIHGRGSRVPRKLNLTLLTDIAVLVDKYRLHEVVSIQIILILAQSVQGPHYEISNGRPYRLRCSPIFGRMD